MANLNNQWIQKINDRNSVISEFKATNRQDYIKLKYGLTHGKGKGTKKRKK